jgi:TPR repeat protein
LRGQLGSQAQAKTTPNICTPAEATLKLTSLLAALSLVWPLCASAGFDDGVKAADHADYITALQNWQPLAAEGHAASQYNLGLMYDRGLGVPRDPNLAAHWYAKAAQQGFARAQNHLGSLYEHGLGVPQSLEQAQKWYQLAAAQGNAWAQRNLDRLLKAHTSAPLAQ